MLLGMNTTGVFNWEANAQYNNVFNVWEPEWGINAAKPYDRSVLAPLNAFGYPTGPGTAATFSYMWGYPAGDYEFLMKGSGTPKFGGKLSFASDAMAVADGYRRWLVRVTPREQMATLVITDINANDPITDLKLWVPNCDKTKKWTTWYLDKLRPLSCLRFLDAFGTNGDPKAKWTDRPSPADRFSTANPELKGSVDAGQPYEDAINLCNELGVACWVTTPYLPFVNRGTEANNMDYIEQMAALFLGLKGKVIVETWNEMWNRAGGFGQGQWLINQAGWNYNQAATMAASIEYEYAKIWNKVWSDAGRLGDCLPTKGCQASSPNWATLGLKFLKDSGVNPADVFYGLHKSAYATGDGANETDIANALIVDATNVRATNTSHMALAKDNGLVLLDYEGGPFLSGKAAWPLKLNVYRSDASGTAYGGIIQEEARVGTALYNHFCGPYVRPAEAGTWGLNDAADTPMIPKDIVWTRIVGANKKGDLPPRKLPARTVKSVVVQIKYSDGSTEERSTAP
jgi:hypothetical protein